jgi:hypothetical protein
MIGTPSLFEQFLAKGGRELRKGEMVGPPAYAYPPAGGHLADASGAIDLNGACM